jgi:ABC-type nitrate/sulfonate/bicarbonate transport system permease component
MSLVKKELLDMAKVYRMPTDRIIRYIYIPALLGKFRKKK